ncbi:MAG TPA: glycosyltransferase family 4 protein [Gaiellaceae bacterium]|nr:glycosyltransferase family 4 protein [Gaiellaceae bacterium]
MALRILHCVEFYHPSPGGAQAVVRHVSRELVRRGHDVTIATTRLAERRDAALDGARIEEFEVSGNAVRGLAGEVERYRSFVADGDFDVVMTYAAQQWTTDALLPVLEGIPYGKVLAPCGFSGLSDPSFAAYFAALPERLARFDELIFHSDTYQDIEFARGAGLENLNVVPNGAAREEFEGLGSDFRERQRIDPAEPLLLTVGPHNWRKGHALAIEGFRRGELDGGTLVVIGNTPLRLGCQWDCRRRAVATRIGSRGRRRVRVIDVPREEALSAYKAADLFVFGSQVEASPLVLFEAAASATAFVSTAAGNAEEIAEWTGGGVVVPSERRDGLVTASPDAVAAEVTRLWSDERARAGLAESGRARWLSEFTWDRIAERYEAVYEAAAERSS